MKKLDWLIILAGWLFDCVITSLYPFAYGFLSVTISSYLALFLWVSLLSGLSFNQKLWSWLGVTLFLNVFHLSGTLAWSLSLLAVVLFCHLYSMKVGTSLFERYLLYFLSFVVLEGCQYGFARLFGYTQLSLMNFLSRVFILNSLIALCQAGLVLVLSFGLRHLTVKRQEKLYRQEKISLLK